MWTIHLSFSANKNNNSFYFRGAQTVLCKTFCTCGCNTPSFHLTNMIFTSFVYNRGVCAVALTALSALLQPLWFVAASCRLTTRGRVAQASAAGIRLVDWSDGIDDKSLLNNLGKENTRVIISISFISWLEGCLWPQYLACVGEGLWEWVGGFSWVKPWSPSCHIATNLQGVEVCFTSNHHSWHACCIASWTTCKEPNTVSHVQE